MSGSKSTSDPPNLLVKDGKFLTVKSSMLNHFIEHFISIGHLFETRNQMDPIQSPTQQTLWYFFYYYYFTPVAFAEVHRSLKQTNLCF